MENKSKEKLQSKIDKVIYAKNRFAVIVLSSGEKCIGEHFLGDISQCLNEEVIVIGQWEKSNKNDEWQFKFDSIEIVNNDSIFFFLTKRISGIGPSLANHLIDTFGGSDKIIELIENRPHELLHVKGLGPKLIEKIKQSWFEHVALRKVSELLLPLGFTNTQVTNIFNYYEEDLEKIISVINEAFYNLISVPGLTFKKVDNIALQNNLVEFNSYKRVSSAVTHCLNSIGSKIGHSAINLNKLFSELDNLLIKNGPNGTNRKFFNYDNVITKMIHGKKVIDLGNKMLCSAYLYQAESYILEFFNKRKHENTYPVLSDDKLQDFLIELNKDFGWSLDKSQSNAVQGINRKSTMALVGYAGTGKSSICRAILKLLESYYQKEDMFVTALSGIATDRIKSLSGYDGSTIQSILVKQQDQPLDYKVLVIDEASMIDTITFYKLLKLVKNNTRVILVGDVGQLPPMAAGAIFIDVVNHELLPVYKLEKIYRQSEGSVIALHADKIRKGIVPEYRIRHKDFCFKELNINSLKQSLPGNRRELNNKRICQHIVKAFEQKVQYLNDAFKAQDFDTFLYSHQVISPMIKGILGVENINQQLQSVLNPEHKGVKIYNYGREKEFRFKDKVLHIKNCNMETMSFDDFIEDAYREIKAEDKKRIFNGYLGAIVRTNTEEKIVWVYYSSEKVIVRYNETEISELLTLGYTMSAHKAQGSAFKRVLIPMTSSQYSMHNTRLLYTSITRAMSMCYLVGESQSFERACKNHNSLNRNTIISSIMTSDLVRC